jgi:hypothetical protein
MSLMGTAGAAALAGFALGAWTVHRFGGIDGAIASFGRSMARAARDRDEPDPSVYELDGLAHDDSDLDWSGDEITLDDHDAQAATDLEERVLAAFLNDPILSDADVLISAEGDGLVTLHGRLADRRQVEHAATIAGGVPGVAGVANKVRVRRSRRARTR